MEKELLNYRGWKLFFILTFLYTILGHAINLLFLSDNLYYQSFGEQFSIERIDEILEFSKKWQWISYFFYQ